MVRGSDRPTTSGAGSAVEGAGATPWRHRSARPIAPKPATIAPWRRWVFEGSENIYDARREEMVAWQPPSGGSRSVPMAPGSRSESPTGYSSAGCSPAEPASASPVTDIVVQSRPSAAIQMRCSTPLRRCSPSRAPRARRERECHLDFARRVTFLSCATPGRLLHLVSVRRILAAVKVV